MFKQLYEELHAIETASKRISKLLDEFPCFHTNVSVDAFAITNTRPGADGEPVEFKTEAIRCDDCNSIDLPEEVVERGWEESVSPCCGAEIEDDGRCNECKENT